MSRLSIQDHDEHDVAARTTAVQSIVRNVWNHVADEYNQWDNLSRQERDELLNAAIADGNMAERKPEAGKGAG